MPNDNNSRTFIPTFPGAPHFRLPFRSVYMPVVPCVLDGTLSLLELIAKLEYVINQYHDAIEANHTDILALATELETSLADLREYIDAQDAATLDAAKVYADGLDAALRVYIDAQDADTLELAKDYAEALRDALKIYVDQQDAATLSSAKAYADALRDALKTYVDTQDAATLTAAKTYADGLVATLRAYVDAQLALKQDVLTFDDLPTTGSNNPVTSNGIAAALTSVQGLIGILRDDLETAIANTRYDVTIADSTNPALPAGVTRITINNAANANKIVRMFITDLSIWAHYCGNGTFMSYDLGNTELIIIDVTMQNTVRINRINLASLIAP